MAIHGVNQISSKAHEPCAGSPDYADWKGVPQDFFLEKISDSWIWGFATKVEGPRAGDETGEGVI
jgi:hypothetical protein